MHADCLPGWITMAAYTVTKGPGGGPGRGDGSGGRVMAEVEAGAGGESGRSPQLDDGPYDVIIVGAGIGGLACGALLAKEGLAVLAIDRQDRPGGYVTAYDRKGFSFEVPHLVGGAGPGGDLTRVMDHLGIRLEFVDIEPYHRYVYPDHDIDVSSDAAAYLETLKDNFQPQTSNLNGLFATIARVQDALEPGMFRGSGGALRRLALAVRSPRAHWYQWRGATFRKLLDEYVTDERLKTVLATPWPCLGAPPWEVSALSMVAMMKSFSGGAQFPLGGYRAFSEAFTAAFVDNGGTLLMGDEVLKINVSEGRVATVDTRDRTAIRTNAVVSDVDTKRTFLHLIDRENFTRGFLERVEEMRATVSGFAIHLGMAKEVEDARLGYGMVFVRPTYDERENLAAVGSVEEFPDPASIGYSMMVHSMQDPGLAPDGGACLDILVPGVPYHFMDRWGVEPGGEKGKRYQHLKEKYAEVVVDAVRLAFPGFVDRVQAYDLTTPVTYELYTMATDGCWFDSAPVPDAALSKRLGPDTPIAGLYLTGSKSVLGGGIYGSVMNGLLAADALLEGRFDNVFAR